MLSWCCPRPMERATPTATAAFSPTCISSKASASRQRPKSRTARPRSRMFPSDYRQMKVLIFGATGMVGQGVLRECLLTSDVDLVVTVGRAATGQQNPKLREIVRPDLF